jgi:hypothetical protein
LSQLSGDQGARWLSHGLVASVGARARAGARACFARRALPEWSLCYLVRAGARAAALAIRAALSELLLPEELLPEDSHIFRPPTSPTCYFFLEPPPDSVALIRTALARASTLLEPEEPGDGAGGVVQRPRGGVVLRVTSSCWSTPASGDDASDGAIEEGEDDTRIARSLRRRYGLGRSCDEVAIRAGSHL